MPTVNRVGNGMLGLDLEATSILVGMNRGWKNLLGAPLGEFLCRRMRVTEPDARPLGDRSQLIVCSVFGRQCTLV